MRNFIFSGAYWGAVLVLIGLGYIYNTIAEKNLPVFKIAFGIIVLTIGIQIIYSTISPNKTNFVMFKGSKVNHTSAGDYSVVFGSTVIDLTNVDLTQGDVVKTVEVVFGGADVYIPRDVPIEIKSETVLGSTESPFGNSSGFGDRKFTQGAKSDTLGTLVIKSECVFGSISFRFKKAKPQESSEDF
ncbi:MAG: LiaF-related protein [Candidatus Zophobacter franzmannii]|nr:LiaF-related protein [Candidatus Zophobacter franzmannii]